MPLPVSPGLAFVAVVRVAGIDQGGGGVVIIETAKETVNAVRC